MAESKQAVLPLWGEQSGARSVHLNATGRFHELCDEFLAADLAKDEAGMQAACHSLRLLVSLLEGFQRAQFRKWAKEREAQRR